MATKMSKSKKRNCINLVARKENEGLATKKSKSKKRNCIKLVARKKNET